MLARVKLLHILIKQNNRAEIVISMSSSSSASALVSPLPQPLPTATTTISFAYPRRRARHSSGNVAAPMKSQPLEPRQRLASPNALVLRSTRLTPVQQRRAVSQFDPNGGGPDFSADKKSADRAMRTVKSGSDLWEEERKHALRVTVSGKNSRERSRRARRNLPLTVGCGSHQGAKVIVSGRGGGERLSLYQILCLKKMLY